MPPEVLWTVPEAGMPSFAELGLPEPVLRALTAGGFTAPFPIQAATLPETLAGRVARDPATAASRPALVAGSGLDEARALLARRERSYAGTHDQRGLRWP